MPPPLPLNTIDVIVAPEQIICDDGAEAAAPGPRFTVTVEVIAVPLHPFAVGVMVNVTVTGEPVVLVKVPAISPEPVDAIPVTEPVLFLVQLYVAPPVVLLSAIAVMGIPEHTVCDDRVATATGLGFTSTVALFVQEFELGVMVNVT